MIIGPVKFAGSLWRNGEFGVSRLRETSFSSHTCEMHDPEHVRWTMALVEAHGIEAVLEYSATTRTSPRDIGLSLVQNSPKGFIKGLKGISSYGRKMVRNAADWLTRRYGRHCLTFGTVTIPSCTSEQYVHVARDWSLIVKRFLKSLGRDLTRSQLTPKVVSVTEIQEGRFQNSGIPALHLHFVFVGRTGKKTAWQLKPQRVRELWKRAFLDLLPEDTNWAASENLQQVKKSASGYLGKYLTKGSESVRKLVAKGLSNLLPSTWWNCSMELRKDVLKERLSGPDVAEFLERLATCGDTSIFAYLRPIVLEMPDGFKYTVGYCGRITEKYLDMVYSTASDIRLTQYAKVEPK